ncbi:MAG: peptidase S8 [Myxococcales bacterium]|nr:peptidase S8 [Myxococcales bacterium]
MGLVAAGVTIHTLHSHEDDGVSADELAAPTMAQAMAATDDDQPATTGALLLDLVEPEDGEGGSEEALAELLASLELPVEPAGVYSEGEHLFRVHGAVDSLAQLQASLADHPLVEGVEPELIYSVIAPEAVDGWVARADEDSETSPARRQRFEPNDEKFHLQWHMEMIRSPEAWSVTRGRGVTVAVIDTGVAWKNADGARQVPDLAGTEFRDGKSFVSGLPDGLDDHLHGTHVAGTIAQTTHNEIGVTGVAFDATIMPLKVLAADGRGSVADIANAIRYAADQGAEVINMSLGGPLPSRVMAKAIEYANSKGTTVVCAAGNESKSRVGYPAGSKGAIAVAAVDAVGKRTWYSNWGKQLDISAPGGDTRADRNGDGHPDGVLQNTIHLQDPMRNDYMWLQGTSMASPHAAGVAALIVARGVTNPTEVERILKETAVHPNNVEWDKEYGAGVIDAAAAVDAATSDYQPERLALGGLLGLLALALGGVGVGSLASSTSATRRRFARDGVSVLAGAGVAAGVFGLSPLAYGLAGSLGNAAAFGSPLLLSALVPVLLVLSLLSVKPLRGLLAGVSLGYAALLLHGAIVLPTLVDGLPGGACVDRLWLAVNAAIAVWLAQRVFRLLAK